MAKSWIYLGTEKRTLDNGVDMVADRSKVTPRFMTRATGRKPLSPLIQEN